MDIISFTEAATANTRISSVIADPDSTSGVVTVPKTIASGENITIPSGRVAVLPNVQIDGTLNVQGDVFIPSGATLSGVVEKVISTDNAVVRFNGTTGEVQNSGVIIDDSNRLLVGNTPSGLNTLGQLIVNQPSSGNVNLVLTNKINDSYSYIYNDGTALKIRNSSNTTAGYTPIILQTGGSGRLILDVNGNVGIGVTPSAWSGFNALQQQNTSISSNLNEQYITSNGYYNGSNWIYNSNTGASQYLNNQGIHTWKTAPSGTAGNAITWTNAMTLTNTGNLLVGTTTDNGVDKLQVNGSIAVLNRIDIISESGATPQVTKEFTRTADSSGGAGILSSVYGDVPTCGELYVQELGTDKYLNATFYKRGASYAPVVTVLVSNGLTFGSSNEMGTQVINGATNNANVRMMSKIRKIYA